MEYAITLNAVTPIRKEDREQSEMVSQMLFGEICIVTKANLTGSFVNIKNQADDYLGWVDKKMLTEISEELYLQLISQPKFVVCVPIADTFCQTDKTIYRLSASSRLPLYDPEKSSFQIAGKIFQIHPSFVSYLSSNSKENIIAAAMLFLNTPYLWGGKNIFGMDCSGFVQVVYSLNGYQLTRDASMQVEEGSAVTSFHEAESTDLLFFGKEGIITHVGIYLGDGKIIHASGRVKIEQVDEKGIINSETGQYSHFLAAIRRI